MDVLERTMSRLECPEHGADHIARWASGKRTCWLCNLEPVEIEYVRADIHQGAVEDRDVLKLALEDVCGDTFSDDEAAFEQYVRRARARLGGR